MIGFYLKKTIAFFVEPFGFTLLLLGLALFFLYTKRLRFAKFVLVFCFFYLFLLAYPPFSNLLVAPLENAYKTYRYDANISYIHVLGSGNNDDFSQPISSMLGDAALKRVVEGVVIHKKQPSTRLIFTGYAGAGLELSTAKANAMMALELGVNKADLIVNENPKDTKEETLYVKSIVKQAPFVLVTSAMHMPRAMRLYREIGLNPIAAPCDFRKQKIDSLFILPTVYTLQNSHTAIHEYLGILWEKLH